MISITKYMCMYSLSKALQRLYVYRSSTMTCIHMHGTVLFVCLQHPHFVQLPSNRMAVLLRVHTSISGRLRIQLDLLCSHYDLYLQTQTKHECFEGEGENIN